MQRPLASPEGFLPCGWKCRSQTAVQRLWLSIMPLLGACGCRGRVWAASSELADNGLRLKSTLKRWNALRRVQQWLQLAQQGLDVVQVFGYFVRWQDVFVEVLVEHADVGSQTRCSCGALRRGRTLPALCWWSSSFLWHVHGQYNAPVPAVSRCAGSGSSSSRRSGTAISWSLILKRKEMPEQNDAQPTGPLPTPRVRRCRLRRVIHRRYAGLTL